MPEPINPYAAPATMEMHPKAAEWLGTPNESLRRAPPPVWGLFGLWGVLILLCIVGGFFGGILLGIGRAGPDVMQLFQFAFAAVLIVAGLLNLVGGIFCLATPSETGAQGLIYASVGCQVLSVIINLAATFGAIPADALKTAAYTQQLLALISSVTFVLYLRRLSLFIGRTDLAQRAVTLLILGAMMIGLIVVLIVGAVLAVGNAQANNAQALGNALAGLGGLTVIVMISLVVLFLVALVKYVNVLGDMKSAILTGR